MFGQNIFLTFLIAASVFFISAAPVAAAGQNEDISSIFCEKMQDADIYDDRQFESYRMLIPGDDGWIFRTKTDLISDFTISREALQNMRDLNHAFETRGIKLVYFTQPTRGLVHGHHIHPDDRKRFNFSDIDKSWTSYWALINDLRKAGIAAVGLQRPKPDESFFYKRDHHWNADGARLSAFALADYIKKIPEFKNIEKVSFVTKDLEEDEFYGVSKKVFKKICGTSQPPEHIIRKVTEHAVEAGSKDDLFGEVKIPEIVLLGTSNSTMEPSYANFEGFLKEALGTDVLNMSVSGGGLDTAMLAYFNSENYKKNPAKIAIWEAPAYYEISNQGKLFREAIPAAYGSCEKPVAEAKGVKLEDKTVIAMSKLADKKIYGNNHYLNIHFSQPVLKPFNVEFFNLKGRDKHRFQHSNRYAQERDFFLRLGNEKDNPLDKVILSVPKELMGLSVDAKICQQPGSGFSLFFFAKK